MADLYGVNVEKPDTRYAVANVGRVVFLKFANPNPPSPFWVGLQPDEAEELGRKLLHHAERARRARR